MDTAPAPQHCGPGAKTWTSVLSTSAFALPHRHRVYFSSREIRSGADEKGARAEVPQDSLRPRGPHDAGRLARSLSVFRMPHVLNRQSGSLSVTRGIRPFHPHTNSLTSTRLRVCSSPEYACYMCSCRARNAIVVCACVFVCTGSRARVPVGRAEASTVSQAGKHTQPLATGDCGLGWARVSVTPRPVPSPHCSGSIWVLPAGRTHWNIVRVGWL